MSRYIAHEYQDFAFNHVINHDNCGLFLDMGLGKTVIMLTAMNHLKFNECEIERFLVIAPKQVTLNVWKQEAAKWDHLKHLKVSIVWGTEKERIAALRVKADIYVINRENIQWLVSIFESKFPFQMVVLDELSSFKNHQTKRFKCMKMVRSKIKRLVGLTGTPAPNSLLDLWAPMFLLDGGLRLGETIGGYRARYFVPGAVDGHIVHGYTIRKQAKEAIYKLIGDICISMKQEDYLELPPLIENNVILEMDKVMQAKYDEFEEESIIELLDKEITALNAAALTNKLLQFASGAVYHDKMGNYTDIHDIKLDALEDIMKDALGKPVLVFYAYQHGLKKILKRFPHARLLKTPKDLEDWNAGNIQMLIAHPKSAGHGLNMQEGGNIMVWYGLTWSLEEYLQAVARLMRQGQMMPVIVHKLIMKRTMDTKVAKILIEKEKGQDDLMNAVKARVEEVRIKVRLKGPAGSMLATK